MREPSLLLRILLVLLPFLREKASKKIEVEIKSELDEKGEKGERSEKTEKSETSSQFGGRDKDQMKVNNDKANGIEKIERTEKLDKLDKLDKSDKSDKSDKPDKTTRRRKRKSTSASIPPLGRLLKPRERKILVLDLDETLIHSMSRSTSKASQIVEVHLKTLPVSSMYYITKRPHCLEFLQTVAQWYELAIFTAGVQEYADPIIDLLERDLGFKCFKRRYYRHHCTAAGDGQFIKDLTVLNEDLRRVMLVDNSPISLQNQKHNGIIVEGWILDPSDKALLQLLPLLYALRHATDVRSVLCLQNGRKLGLPEVPAAETLTPVESPVSLEL